MEASPPTQGTPPASSITALELAAARAQGRPAMPATR